MTENVYSINADEDLARLSELMDEVYIRHVPVVDDEGDLLGIVSQRDLLRSALFASEDLPQLELRDLLKKTAVREIMTADPATAEPGEEIEEAGRTMLDNNPTLSNTWSSAPASNGTPMR
jgi:acetoin utilization protein AcuB